MPSDRAPTPQSHTTLSVGDFEDRNSERSDSIATIEIFRTDAHPEPESSGTPSENTECENISRHRASGSDDIKNFIPTDIPELPLERKKSSGLSKGVILSALNFGGSYDLKCDPKESKEKEAPKDHELCENGSASPKALEASAEANGKAPEEEKGEEKKKMSLPRKIAFGFSFLPSVMFVLTFAVILPCEEYKLPGGCVKNKWSLLLNQTEITSYFSLPQMLLFGYQSANTSISSGGLINLNEKTGDETWRRTLDSSPEQIECRNVDGNQDDVPDCLTVLKNGDVRAFNLSNGKIFWTYSINQPKDVTVLLTGCRYKNFRPIAVASYSNGNVLLIDVLSEIDGSVLISKEVRLVTKCLSSAFSMQPWNNHNETDLVYYCADSHGSAHIGRVKQNDWCPQEEEEAENNVIVPQNMITFDGNRTDSVYLPATDGLLLWTSTEVTFVHRDGEVKWQYSTDYLPRDRIVKFGNFYMGGEQVALIAKNASYYTDGIVVSVLATDSGKELVQLSYAYRTVKQAVVLKGNETDSLLVSAIMVKETEPEQKSDKEVVLKSNVNSSEDFRKYVAYDVTQRKAVEDLLLLQFEGKNTTHVVFQSEVSASCWKDLDLGAPCKSEYQANRILAASSEKGSDSINLKIVTLRATGDQPGESQSSQLTALDITHHDTSDGESSCSL